MRTFSKAASWDPYPGEFFVLRWENIDLNGSGGLIQITEGKTRAARRLPPMLPLVYAALNNRHTTAGQSESAWVFLSSSREGHFNKDTAKDQHAKAIQAVNKKAKKNGTCEPTPFQPYVLRHTALTQLAQAGCDAFTLARIAGHSSITITQRYIHPQADATKRAFAPFAPSVNSAPSEESEQVGTKLAQPEMQRT